MTRGQGGPDSGELAGRTVAIVGIGEGGDVLSNGRATALAFSRAGARLVLVDRSEDALTECAKQVGDLGAEHSEFTVEATDETQVRAAINAATEVVGCIDVLHNNLGITQYGHLPARRSRTSSASWTST